MELLPPRLTAGSLSHMAIGKNNSTVPRTDVIIEVPPVVFSPGSRFWSDSRFQLESSQSVLSPTYISLSRTRYGF
jgi:hypothetical protein